MAKTEKLQKGQVEFRVRSETLREGPPHQAAFFVTPVIHVEFRQALDIGGPYENIQYGEWQLIVTLRGALVAGQCPQYVHDPNA